MEGPQINFELGSVQALQITRCHIDHLGRLPWLLAAGFKAPIYATEATAHLLPLVIEDALKVGVTRDHNLIESVIQYLGQLLRPVPYDQVVELFPGCSACFREAGHILGSAYIEVDTGQERVVFSGDLGASDTPLLKEPVSPQHADVLVLESTYGDRAHENRRQRRSRLRAVVEHCLQDAGTVLIPAFSIGRTQELIYELEQIIHKHPDSDWDTIDVVVDSPLAARFTDSYRQLRDLWDQEAKMKVSEGRHPLSFEQLITVDNHDEHHRLVQYLAGSGRPAIVIAASGMCAGGRIMNYLKALLDDPRTDLLFVGYQAVGTPGHAIQKYGPRGGYVMLEGIRYDIKAKVHTLSGYSAHADQTDLIQFVSGMGCTPKEIRLVHGSDQAKGELAEALARVCPDSRILIPSG